ncbi:hypothetical protein H6F95_06810 [Cyanobacteria bacterium FACHB-471]|nr:hypothetical protein [Cyanobacteria bacterium FACHB-471]
MLSHHPRPVCLSFTALDLPLWSVLETSATLYQRENEQFHLLLTEPWVQERADMPLPRTSSEITPEVATLSGNQTPRLLWLEISPYRVIMTMQGNGQFSYRHFWEQGVYGISRYWLQGNTSGNEQLRLRNFTRSLKLIGGELPHHLRVEYELWSGKVQLGHYVMNVEIRH